MTVFGVDKLTLFQGPLLGRDHAAGSLSRTALQVFTIHRIDGPEPTIVAAYCNWRRRI